jgi:hypothetical protein
MNISKINNILEEIKKDDENLFKHLEMTGMLAYSLAQEMKLSTYDKELAYTGGLISDIDIYYINKFAPELKKLNVDEKNSKDIKKLLQTITIFLNDELKEQLNFNWILSNDDEIKQLKLIVEICSEYDNNRRQGMSHEKTATLLRTKFKDVMNIITLFLMSIIKNKLDKEYY